MKADIFEQFKGGLQHQWNICGDDLLGSVEGCTCTDDQTSTMSRDDVFACSADLYIGTLGMGELQEAWFAMTKADRETLKHAAFQHEIYGY